MKRPGTTKTTSGSGPGAASVPPTATTTTSPTTLFSLPSLSFFSSSHARSRLETTPAGPATTGGVATFANGATFGDPFSFQPKPDDDFTSYTPTHQRQEQERYERPRQHRYQQPQSPSTFKGLRRRANSSYSLRDRNGARVALGIDTYGIAAHGGPSNLQTAIIDNGRPPALPEFALSSAAKLSRDPDVLASYSPIAKSSLEVARNYFQNNSSSARMLSRTGSTPMNGFPVAGGMMAPPPLSGGPHGEYNIMYQHVQEVANKRISTLEYLRKAYVLWFLLSLSKHNHTPPPKYTLQHHWFNRDKTY